MNHYRIIDNQTPSRNVYVQAENKNNAMDRRASLLRTANVRAIKLKNPPDLDKEREHRMMMNIF